MSIVANWDVIRKSENRMANRIDPDETVHYPSHLDLYCLQRYMFWSVGLKEITYFFCCFCFVLFFFV